MNNLSEKLARSDEANKNGASSSEESVFFGTLNASIEFASKRTADVKDAGRASGRYYAEDNMRNAVSGKPSASKKEYLRNQAKTGFSCV